MLNDYTLQIGDLSITKNAESCRLIAYWDATGKCWTIGWGHTGPDVFENLVWSQFKADSQLLVDMSTAEQGIKRLVKIQLTRDQFIALADFVFNVGVENFARSTLLLDINTGMMTNAAREFLRWDLSGGVILGGLKSRRDAERALFILGTDYSAVAGSDGSDNATVQLPTASVA